MLENRLINCMKLGAIKLESWLAGQKPPKRPSHFAKDIGKSPSTIHRILDGTNCPDIETANLIRQHTGIDLEDWITEPTKKQMARVK